MVTFQAQPVLMVAFAVWATWRMAIWRRQGGDLVREMGMAGLLAWILVVVSLTFFPFRIVLYDWYGSANLVPFASIAQLITETVPEVAIRNILGNVVLFVPFGLLLPLLFHRMQAFWPFIWRIVVISVGIEILQIFTRARSIDVDDVILNALGGAIGFGLLSILRPLLDRSDRVVRLLNRLSGESEREPLLSAAIPVLATLAIVVPLMLASINAATLSSGDDGVGADATSIWPGSSVVASAEVNEFLFLMLHEGTFQPELLALVEYERVLPGRYTRTSWGDMPLEADSQFLWQLSAFNTARNELPVVALWGSNAAGATTLRIRNVGLDQSLELPAGRFFVVAIPYDIEEHQGFSDVLQDFDVSFFDDAGRDLTDEFEWAR